MPDHPCPCCALLGGAVEDDDRPTYVDGHHPACPVPYQDDEEET